MKNGQEWQHIRVPASLHAAFKIYCIQTKIKMQDLSADIITEFLHKQDSVPLKSLGLDAQQELPAETV